MKVGDTSGKLVSASGSGGLVNGGLESPKTDTVGDAVTGSAGIDRRVLIVANTVFKIASVVERYVSHKNLP